MFDIFKLLGLSSADTTLSKPPVRPIPSSAINQPIVISQTAINAAMSMPGALGLLPTLITSTTPATPSLLSIILSVGATQPPPCPSPQDTVILTSGDGTIFTTSRALLSAHSPVFAAAFGRRVSSSTIPSPVTVKGINLPCTSSAGISLILAVLSIYDLHPKPQNSPALINAVRQYAPQLSASDVAAIGEALECAREYQITSFSQTFIWGLLVTLPNLSPVVGFTLLAVVARRSQGRHRVYAARMLGLGITSIPRALATGLQRYAVEHVARFDELVQRDSAGLRVLGQNLRYHAPLIDGGPLGYTARCRGEKERSRYTYYSPETRYHSPCSAFRAQSNWTRLRERAADAVLEKVKRDVEAYGPGGYEGILPTVDAVVPCQKCARRLAQAFDAPISRFRVVRFGY